MLPAQRRWGSHVSGADSPVIAAIAFWNTTHIADAAAHLHEIGGPTFLACSILALSK